MSLSIIVESIVMIAARLVIFYVLLRRTNGLLRIISENWDFDQSLNGYVYTGSVQSPSPTVVFAIPLSTVSGPRTIIVSTLPTTVGFLNGSADQYSIGAQLRQRTWTIEVPGPFQTLSLTLERNGAAVALPRVYQGSIAEYTTIQALKHRSKDTASVLQQETSTETYAVVAICVTSVVLILVFIGYSYVRDKDERAAASLDLSLGGVLDRMGREGSRAQNDARGSGISRIPTERFGTEERRASGSGRGVSRNHGRGVVLSSPRTGNPTARGALYSHSGSG